MVGQDLEKKEHSYACENCQELVLMQRKDYHEQYLCDRIIKAKKQAAQQKIKTNNQIQNLNQDIIRDQIKKQQAIKQALLPSHSQEHYNKDNNTQSKKVQQQNKQNMDFLQSMIPFIKKTNSDIYEELNEEEKAKLIQKEENKQENEKEQRKPKQKYEQKKQSQSKILSKREIQARRSRVQEAMKKKNSKLSKQSRIPPRNPRSTGPPPRRAQSMIKDNKVECTSCSKMISLQQIDEHEFSCGLEMECDFCGLPLQIAEIEEHEKICEIKEMWEEQKMKEKYGMGGFGQGMGRVWNRTYYDDYDDEHGDYNLDYNQYNHYNNDYSLQQQHPNNLLQSSKKHKGLTNSKLSSLQFSSYRKQKNNSSKQPQQQEQPCSICYLAYEENQTIIRLPCLHTFHPECVGKWFEGDDRCPMCKVKVQ